MPAARSPGVVSAVFVAAVAACAKPVPVAEMPTPAAEIPAACSTYTMARRDTLVAVIYASTGFDRPASADVRTFREAVLQSILASYAPPERFAVPMLDAAALPAETSAVLGRVGPRFDGELVIAVGANGRVTDVRTTGAPDAFELMPGLRDAVFRTDSAGAVPPLPPGLSGVTEVGVRIFATGSQVPPPTDPTAKVFQVAEARLPYARLEIPALAIGGAGTPRYPPHLKTGNVQGVTTLQFVIDASGRGIAGTARVVHASHPDFAAAVVDALPRMRFIPGRIDGCPVTSWVRQRFEFRLGR